METSVAPRGSALIVDDEASVRSVLVRTLSPQGFVCSTASNGEAALSLLDEREFDVVISDLQMPGISGLEFLKQCRAQHPHTVFLMITAEDDVQVGIEAMKRGAADYLVKPFHIQGLSRSIERALEKE